MQRPTIPELRQRIARKRAAGHRTDAEAYALQLAVTEQLAAEIDKAQREQARDRREPGSRQREFDRDE